MFEHTPSPRLPAPVRPGLRTLAGFTAIEVTAVATIIALMSLVLIPIVRNRVEESKVVAAQDELAQIEKAEMMAFGDTGHYYRLQDLTRPAADPTEKNNPAMLAQVRLKVPLAFWDQPIVQPNETTYLIDNWKGPYFTIQHGQPIAKLVRANPALWRGDAQITGAATLGTGPTMVLQADDFDWENINGGALEKRLYPIDPWGNPYLFFGSGKIDPSDLGGQMAITAKGSFATATAVSTGPNGAPGPDPVQIPLTSLSYFREMKGTTGLGTGDDISREF